MSALRKVLVVDDDPVVGTSFERVLSGKGYVVINAHNAAEALEQLRREDPDLVFTDIKMPGMDGLQLAETLKARRPWTPVVIVTGYGTPAAEARAKAAGVSGFLHKPLSPEMIEDSAERALHGEALEAGSPPPTPVLEARARPAAPEGRARNVALFLAAPFIGLVYAVFLPFVGLGLLAWMGTRKLLSIGVPQRAWRALLTGTKVAFAPFIGLAYIVLLPFAGLAALAWFGGRTLIATRRGE